ncbi:MAG: cache domain-containing protein, partial [Proteobacteria bacterium]|nr:cache domain-containing protein [Pseudomonadota bacterium]
MIIKSNNNKLSKDYFIISSIIIIAVVIISIWQTWSVYNSQKILKDVRLEKSIHRIENEIQTTFSYVSYLIKFMGQQIINDDPNDLENIAEMLRGKLILNAKDKSKFAWEMFDWSREDKKIIVTTPYGIMKEPIDISYRYYAKMADVEPWVLHTDPADIGVTSGQWIIPAGMGITDSNGKFIGTISMGFNVAKLTRNIESILDSEDVSFVILDKDNKIALSSEDVKYDQNQRDYFSKELGNKLPENGSGRLPLNLIFQNIKYYYYNKIDGYPYTILMGYNKAIFNKEFNETLLPGITGYLIIGTLSLLLLITLRNLVVKPITDLSKIADQISKGKKITRLPRSNSKEITALSKQFVNAIRFMNKEKILKQKAEQDKQKIEELVKIHQEYDKEKEEFLRDMYHMLNTPLNAVI